jgi:hypothetical protein
VRDGTIIVLGVTEGHNGGFVPWFDALDVERGTWRQLPDAPRPRDHFQAAIVGNRLGGGGRAAHLGQDEGDVNAHDPRGGRLRSRQRQVDDPARADGPLAHAARDHVHVLGGESGAPQAAHAEVQALHAPTGLFHDLAPLGRGRHGIQAVVVGSRVWIAAGSGNRGGRPELDSLEALAS